MGYDTAELARRSRHIVAEYAWNHGRSIARPSANGERCPRRSVAKHASPTACDATGLVRSSRHVVAERAWNHGHIRAAQVCGGLPRLSVAENAHAARSAATNGCRLRIDKRSRLARSLSAAYSHAQ